MVAYEITLTDSIRIKYGNHDSKHPKGSLRVAKDGNSVKFSDMNRQMPNSILSVNFDDGDTLTVDGVSIANATATLEALGTDFFSRAASGGASEPDPQVAIVSGESGVHFIRTHQPDTVEPIVTGEEIVTGHDLTTHTRGYLEIHVVDVNGNNKWQPQKVDVESLLNNAGSVSDASAQVFSGGFLRVDLIDAATGTITIGDDGRALSYIRSDLFVYAPTALQRIDVFDGDQDLTSSYANFGDPQDELTLIADGDQIEFIYGDGTSANGLFVNDIANVGRQGGVASETRIVDSQLQVRSETGSANSNVVRITIFRRSFVTESPARLDCLPQTTLTPATDWTLTEGMQVNGDNLLIGSGGRQDGVAEYDYTVPVGNRSTRHTFSFTLREVDAAGNDIALRVEIEQAGSVFASRDLLTTEVAQSIALDFVPTADIKIRIRDTSTGSQGSNRDALVSAMQIEATCQVSSLSSMPTDSVVHSIVQTDNIDDSTVGSKITIVTGTAIHLGTQEVTFATNGDITLPQQPQPYILKWYGGFDMDGDPDQETRVAFAGPTLYSLDATADAFDTTVEGSDDNSGANTTFSIFQWMRPVAIAVIDASAGPVTTSLTFTEGGAAVGPTGGTIEIENIGGPIADAGVATNEEVTQQLAALQNQFDINSIDLTTIPDLQFDVKAGERWVFEVNLLANILDLSLIHI